MRILFWIQHITLMRIRMRIRIQSFIWCGCRSRLPKWCGCGTGSTTLPPGTQTNNISCAPPYLWCRAWYCPGRRGEYLAPGGEHADNVQGTISDILCPSLPLVPSLILSQEERWVFGSRWRTRRTMYKVQSAISCVPPYLWCRAWYCPGRRGEYLAPGGEHAEQCTRCNQRYLVSLPTSGAEPNIVPGGEVCIWLQVENTQHNVQGTISNILRPYLRSRAWYCPGRRGEYLAPGGEHAAQCTRYNQQYLASLPLEPSLILSRHERRVFGSRLRTRSTLSGSAFKRLLTPQMLHKTTVEISGSLDPESGFNKSLDQDPNLVNPDPKLLKMVVLKKNWL